MSECLREETKKKRKRESEITKYLEYNIYSGTRACYIQEKFKIVLFVFFSKYK